MATNIDHMKIWCQKVLPLVYDDSLSYYEVLCKVVAKTNELITYLDNYEAKILAQAYAYTDKEVGNLRVDFTGQLADYKKLVDGLLAGMQNQIDDTNRDIAQKYVELNNSILTLYARFDAYRGEIDDRFVSLSQTLKAYIDEVMASADRLYVINPTNGQFEPIQIVLDDMYKALRWGSITAGEYDSLELTAIQYDLKGLTAQEYDFSAKFKFFELLYNRMYSPFSGMKETFDVVINQLANLHKIGLTAEEYDAKQLTSEVYDNLGVTAYEYDWYGRNTVIA